MGMTLYDQVLAAPDTQTRKQALDKLCRKQLIAGMRMRTDILNFRFFTWANEQVDKAAAELEKADE